MPGRDRPRFDAVVAGAGPAGSVAALTLARGGARVALADKASFPRDKACGDLVGPRGVQVLADSAPINALAKVEPDDLAYLVYTSGTASRPKGVMHTQRSWMAELRTILLSREPLYARASAVVDTAGLDVDDAAARLIDAVEPVVTDDARMFARG